MSEERKAIIPMDEYNELREFYDRVNAGETATVMTEYNQYKEKVVFKFTPATEALKTAQAVNESLLARIQELKKEQQKDTNNEKGYLEQLEINAVLAEKVALLSDKEERWRTEYRDKLQETWNIKSMSLLRLIRWYLKKK